MKECSKCKTKKSLSEFNKKGKRKDGTCKLQPYCKSCQSLVIKSYYKSNTGKIKAQVKERKPKIVEEIQKYILQYLTNRCCGICKESNILVLEFHHRDPDTKVCEITKLVSSQSRKKLQIELEKCDILCANCHRIETHKQQNSYKWKHIMGL